MDSGKGYDNTGVPFVEHPRPLSVPGLPSDPGSRARRKQRKQERQNKRRGRK